MIVADWQRHAQQLLQAQSSSPQLDARLLLCQVLELDASQLLTRPARGLTPTEQAALNELLSKRIAGSPIAHLVGHVEFYGLRLAVSTEVLVPRPETEELVMLAAKEISQGSSVVDVGTGSGAIAVALKTVRPDLKIYASDNSTAALEVAKLNIATHRLNIKLIESDLLSELPTTDVVLANLPYLPTNRPLDPSVQREPKSALLSGADGLTHYRQLFAQLKPQTKTQLVILEAEPRQHDTLIQVAQAANYSLINHHSYISQFGRN